jgi:hypothetical protein
VQAVEGADAGDGARRNHGVSQPEQAHRCQTMRVRRSTSVTGVVIRRASQARPREAGCWYHQRSVLAQAELDQNFTRRCCANRSVTSSTVWLVPRRSWPRRRCKHLSIGLCATRPAIRCGSPHPGAPEQPLYRCGESSSLPPRPSSTREKIIDPNYRAPRPGLSFSVVAPHTSFGYQKR